MNANELADALKAMESGWFDDLTLKESAAMLRQQQAEIEALKANRKHDFGLGEASGFIKGHKENPYKAITNTKIEPTVVSYTHPKELTDEEIWELHQEHIDEVTCGHSMKTVGFIEFARAILRKAQEK